MWGAEVSDIKQVEFGIHDGKMFFKIGVQMFTLDYDPITTEDFDLMKENLLEALSNAGVNAVENGQQDPVAYLDIGAGGYLDIGSDLTDEDLLKLPNGRHALGIIGTYGVDGYVAKTEAPSVEQPPADVVRELLDEANAVVVRWHSVDWKAEHTGVFINKLEKAIQAAKEQGL
jgi:hypothetical protein